MEPTEALVVLLAIAAGFLTGRRSAADGFGVVARPVRAGGRVAAGVAQHAGSTGATIARRVASTAGQVSAVGIDAAKGAAAGAGFGLIQFRAARHVRGGAAGTATPTATDGASTLEVAGTPSASPLSPSAPGGAPIVLVTGGTRFHRPGCSSVRGDAREVSRDEALAEGRVPCRSCNP